MYKNTVTGENVNLIEVEVPGRTVKVCGPVCPEEFEKLSMDSSLNSFRPAAQQIKSLKEIAGLQDGFVFIAVLKGAEDIIVGYVTFHPPDFFERWGRDGSGPILELGAIEVVPELRSHGIGGSLLEIAFDSGRMEKYIVIATEYYWHWDLEGTGLLIWEYRDRLDRLMGSAGLLPEETTDPEINSHPANALMVRVGSNVSTSDAKAFEQLRLL